MKKLVLISAFLVLSFVSVYSQTPKQINGGILNGKATSLPKPEYPESAKAAGLEGTVEVKVIIDEGGNVVSAVANAEPRKIYRATNNPDQAAEEIPAPDPLLRDAAERAAWEAKFSPTMLSGVPVKVQGTLVYRFVGPRKSADAVDTTSYIGPRHDKAVSGILNGKAITLPKPAYPPAALAVRAGGTVTVQVTIDEEGLVNSAAAVSGHPLLRAAAVEAARGAVFSPTTLSGVPVKISGVVVYNFIPPDPKENP